MLIFRNSDFTKLMTGSHAMYVYVYVLDNYENIEQENVYSLENNNNGINKSLVMLTLISTTTR